MKVVYDERYNEVYSSDPAAMPGRIESIYDELRGDYQFVKPKPATEEDLRLIHGENHISSVRKNRRAYDVAVLAGGGAIKAAELALEDEPSFGLIRPPGHHASRNSSWGFCYFNNIAISIEKLRRRDRVSQVLVVDIDLHYGDGTAGIFAGNPDVSYFHVKGQSRKQYLDNFRGYLHAQHDYGIIAVSAGFDRHEEDWGGLLRTEDYLTIGRTIKQYAEREADGRRYAVLEGGYNLEVLGKNVKSLLRGMT
ncbi:MAG: histone deacetylase family protein [Candidatus Bathyarchaeota archaeon]|nr:MAG: histone deacetylase family protein [Candidatus Bathyarchaeota archaeon]